LNCKAFRIATVGKVIWSEANSIGIETLSIETVGISKVTVETFFSSETFAFLTAE